KKRFLSCLAERLCITACLLIGEPVSAQTRETISSVPKGASEGVPGITVSLPIDNFDTSVPASTVIIEPVTTTLIDSTTTNGVNYVGFQGDFSFDSAVVSLAYPAAQRAGLTS